MQHEGLVVDARKLQRGRSAIGLRVKGLRRLRCDGRFVLPQGKPPWSFAQSFGRTRDYGILDVIDLIRQQRRHVGTHPRRDGAKGVRLHDAIRGHGTPARRNGEVGRGGSSGKAERTAKDGLHPLLQRGGGRRCGDGVFVCPVRSHDDVLTGTKLKRGSMPTFGQGRLLFGWENWLRIGDRRSPGLLLRTAPEHMPETAHAATHRHTGKTAAYSRFPNSAHRVNGRIGALQFRLREILFRAALPGLFAEFSRPLLAHRPQKRFTRLPTKELAEHIAGWRGQDRSGSPSLEPRHCGYGVGQLLPRLLWIPRTLQKFLILRRIRKLVFGHGQNRLMDIEGVLRAADGSFTERRPDRPGKPARKPRLHEPPCRECAEAHPPDHAGRGFSDAS